uniref:Putative ribosomal protein S4/S9 n=1 Tax=Helianthus annuus TaxID=4232 RepID=A0A251SUL2_HELAN
MNKNKYVLANVIKIPMCFYICPFMWKRPVSIIMILRMDNSSISFTGADFPSSGDGIDSISNHLTLQPFQYKGLVNQIIDSKWVGLKINELLVVEYYSRQT